MVKSWEIYQNYFFFDFFSRHQTESKRAKLS